MEEEAGQSAGNGSAELGDVALELQSGGSVSDGAADDEGDGWGDSSTDGSSDESLPPGYG